MASSKIVMTSQEMKTGLEALAKQLYERHGNSQSMGIVGIQRRGVDLGQRLCFLLQEKFGYSVPFGILDITLYRDDWTTVSAKPSVRETHIPFSIDQKSIVLVDDVLFTGRTIRAALEALIDFGRPRVIELLALVDRGHRELPIQADFVGLTVPTQRDDRVDVLLQERDNEDAVKIVYAG